MRLRERHQSMYFDLVIFLSFIWFLCDEGRVEAPGKRESDDFAGRRKIESGVSSLLVALPTQRAQSALGQYLITCTAEQHAISTY